MWQIKTTRPSGNNGNVLHTVYVYNTYIRFNVVSGNRVITTRAFLLVVACAYIKTADFTTTVPRKPRVRFFFSPFMPRTPGRVLCARHAFRLDNRR